MKKMQSRKIKSSITSVTFTFNFFLFSCITFNFFLFSCIIIIEQPHIP